MGHRVERAKTDVTRRLQRLQQRRNARLPELVGVLSELLDRTNALSVHLVDRSGQLITTAGRSGDFDATSFASLVAADFTANAEISTLLGEPAVEAVVNEGRGRSVHSSMLAGRVILCTVFDRRSTLGLVRYRAQRASRSTFGDSRSHARGRRNWTSKSGR